MKTKVGHSILSESFASGVETAKMASLGETSKLNMLFSSVVYDQEDLIKGVKSVMPNTPIIGCTSSGAIIVPEGYIDSATGFSGMMNFDDEDLVVGLAGSAAGNDPRKIGAKIALDALKNAGVQRIPNYFYMVASPKEEELYLKGIQDIIGRVPFFGGSAADNAVAGDWKIFVNDKVFSDGCAVAFFYTDVNLNSEYTGFYNETNMSGIITKIDGRKLMEIDHVPALNKYAEWTKKPIETLMGGNLLVESILNPLGVKDPIGDLIAIRHPMNGNDDGSMNIGNNLAVNTAVTLMNCSENDLIESTKDVITNINAHAEGKTKGYFLVHCGGRKIAIVDRMEEVYQNILKETKGVPFITIFTFGEYGSTNHSANTCGGLMLSFASFTE